MSLPREPTSRHPRPPLWSSVRGRLLILVIAVTIPALLLAALLTWQGYRHERRAAEMSLAATARAMSVAIDRQLAEFIAFAQSLATSDALRRDDLPGLEARARALTNGKDRWIVLGDTQGQQLVNTLIQTHGTLPKVDLPAELFSAMKRGETYVSNVSIGPLTQRPLLYVAVPVFRGDTLTYLLAFVFEPSALTGAFDMAQIAPGHVLSVLDRTGTIAARSRSPEVFVGGKATPDMVRLLSERDEAVVESRTLEGIDVLTAYHRDPRTGWSVIIGAPRSELFAGARHLLSLGLAFSLLLIALTAVIAFSTAHAVIEGVELVVAHGEELGDGRLPPVRRTAFLELDRLSDTQRHLAERLRARERENARFAAIVASSDDAIVSCSLEAHIESWNPAAERMFGYTAAEAIGAHVGILLPPDRTFETTEVFDRIRRGESVQVETERRRKDGSVLRVSLRVSPVRDAAGGISGACALVHDVTAERRAEERQQAVHELVATINQANALRPMFDAVYRALVTCYEASRSAVLLQRQPEGLSVADTSDSDFQDPARLCARWLEAQPTTEARRLTVSPADLPPDIAVPLRRLGVVTLVIVPLRLENRPLGYLLFTTNSEVTEEFRELRAAETIGSQVGAAIHRQQGAQALEELVAARTASLREMVAQMEEFSYSVSHDLRSPVRAISGYADVLLEDHAETLGPEAKEYLERIRRIAGRMDQLTRDILAYSRLTQREMTLEPVALDRLVADVIAEHAELRGGNADIEVLPPLPVVIGHESSLAQALANLLTNAVKFVRPGQRPHVVIRAEPRGEYTRVWVEDNGIGIKPEHQVRLFGLFERLHTTDKFEGTGVGLAIVRKALEKMAGRVGVESDGATGSRFWFELAVAREVAAGTGETSADRAGHAPATPTPAS